MSQHVFGLQEKLWTESSREGESNHCYATLLSAGRNDPESSSVLFMDDDDDNDDDDDDDKNSNSSWHFMSI